MLFSKAFSFIAVIATFGATFSQAQITDGRYRIWNGIQSARSFPGGHQGPFQSVITMYEQSAGIYELWNVTSDGHGGYIIRSFATGASAYANPEFTDIVVAASNNQSTWYIEEAGSSGSAKLYVIKLPDQDLLWTNTPSTSVENVIALRGADGSAAQRFVFETA